jgi:DNA ligase-associated metallophosphoesterase
VTAFPVHSRADRSPRKHAGHAIAISCASLLADPEGALYWPEQGLLVVARLARLITHYTPRCVIALGDSFHDGGGPARLSDTDREALSIMQRGREWIWITGNHDPEPATGIGGTFIATMTAGVLTFRHLPTGAPGEISGHLHPVARVAHRGRAVSRRCFAADATRMIMPAFGAFTGGLNIRDAMFADVFGTLAFKAHLLGDGRLYAFAAKRCLPD